MAIAGADLPLRDWLTAAAAKRPTPGGGSAAAVAGALAAAMGEMTLNYSTGRKANTPNAEKILRENLAEMTRARELLLRLMVEDQEAYLALIAARELDQTDAAAPDALAAAAQAAIAVPQAIMAAGMSVLACANRVAEHANRHLLSDLAVCCELAVATMRCAGINVRVNLSDLTEDERHRLEAEVASAIARGEQIVREALRKVEARSA